jgi:ABC-2 type transport system permease protein
VRKYWHIVNIGIQNTLVYRANYLFRGVLTLVPLVAILFLWEAVYASKAAGGMVAGYDLAKMISYYLAVMVVDSLTAVTDDDWQIAADIKDGNISQFLLKPMDYMAYRICLFGAGRLVYFAVAVIPMALFILYERHFIYVPVHGATWIWFGFSLILTAILQFLISYTLAMLAFWLLEISTLIFIVFAFENLAGGHLFPLDILPPWLAQILNFMPFPYQLFFPVSIYLEQVSATALWHGLAMQIFWVTAVFILARWTWRRGIKHYEAVGG